MLQVLILLSPLFVTCLHADQPNNVLLPLTIKGSTNSINMIQETEGSRLLSGKKTTRLNTQSSPQTPQNSYRQSLAELPGLLVTEVNNESFASMNFRGLGDPHESFNILLLRDGLPIAADPYGYPASYYVPPMDAVAKIEFIRGGSGLLFGPQPGGVVNFQLRSAPDHLREHKILFKHTYGSFQTYSTYNEITQGFERWSYLVSLHHRQSDGFRQANSGYSIWNPRLNFRFYPSSKDTFFIDADYHVGRHEEPGGLALSPAAGVLSFTDGVEHNTLKFDRLAVDRGQYTIGYDRIWSDQILTEARVWAGRYDRKSFRQKLGGAPAFGGLPLGSANTIESQTFYSRGVDLRGLIDYSLFEQRQKFTVGISSLEIQSPYTSDDGASPEGDGGVRKKDLDRSTRSLAAFIENKFSFGKFALTPGVRFESIEQENLENLNVGSLVPLRRKKLVNEVFLAGLGVQYELQSRWQLYGNVTEGYKPPTFSNTVPRSTGATVSEDIQPARVLNREIGVRGQSQGGYLDLSLFWITYSNQFGQVGTNFQNIGSGDHKGVDLALGHRLYGGLYGYLNASWLDAKYTDPVSLGKTPAYAPGYVYRAGLNYKKGDDWKVQLQTQILAQHYGNDNNTSQFEIPGYSVWDLSGQSKLGRWFGHLSTNLHWGIQNIMDHRYFARVRSNGVEPASPRTFYAGIGFDF